MRSQSRRDEGGVWHRLRRCQTPSAWCQTPPPAVS